MTLLNQIQEIASKGIGVAEALPFASYRAPEVLEAEQEWLFKEDWVFVCSEADVPNAGDYHTCYIAGEAVAVIRGKDGELRALSNVCRHRGAVLLDGSGNAERVTCPYHAWTYSDRGELKGLPFPGNVEINRENHCLPSFKLETWLGLIFVSLNDEVEPLADRLTGLSEILSDYQIDSFTHGGKIERRTWNANWKLAMENFVEGYHFFAVHKNTVEAAASTRDVFYVDGNTDWSVTGGKQLDYPETMSDWLLDRGTNKKFLSICIHPNFVCNLYDNYLAWVRAIPTGPDSCEITTGLMSAKKLYAGKGIEALYEKILNEDREICERVQKGIATQRSRGGKLVELERSVVHFHQYLAKKFSKTCETKNGGTTLTTSPELLEVRADKQPDRHL